MQVSLKSSLSKFAVMGTLVGAAWGVLAIGGTPVSASINSEAEQSTVSPVYQASTLLREAGLTYNQFNSVANGRKYGSRFGYRNGVGRPEGVVVHETATPNASAWAEARYFNNNWTKAYTYVHAVVDDQQTIQLSDTDYGVWGAGPQANNRFIQVELCRVNTRSEFVKSVANDASWIASMLYRYGLTPSRATPSGMGTVWSHHEVSNYLGGTDHVDPDSYFDNWNYSMSEFYSLIKYYYNRLAYGYSNNSSGSSSNSSSSSSSSSSASHSTYTPSYSNNSSSSTGASITTNNSGSTSASVTVNHKKAVTQAPKSYTRRTVMATSRVYTAYGHWTGKYAKARSSVKCYAVRWINGKQYYQIGTNRYVRSINITGTVITLKSKAYIYNRFGQRSRWYYKKWSRIHAYGGTYKIRGKKYRQIGYRNGSPAYIRSGNIR